MEDRFSPAVVDSCELRERSAARVRVVTAAGLRVGLTRRLFAREPLLPSDVEAEEEEQVMRYICRTVALVCDWFGGYGVILCGCMEILRLKAGSCDFVRETIGAKIF